MVRRTPQDERVARQLGATLRAARLAHSPRLTLEKVAEKADLSSDFIARAEDGRHQLTVGVFLRLCAALGLEAPVVLVAAGLVDGAVIDPAVGRIVASIAGRPAEAVALAADLVDAVGRAFPKSSRQPRKRPSTPSP